MKFYNLFHIFVCDIDKRKERLSNYFLILKFNDNEFSFIQNTNIIIIIIGSKTQIFKENVKEEISKTDENISRKVSLFWRWKPNEKKN